MTLWNIIRDFFVEYIFGGITSSGDDFDNIIGQFFVFNHGELDDEGVYGVNEFMLGFNNNVNYSYEIGLGDWLSTTATIITLCAICVFLFFFVRWLFRLTAGLVSGRG